MFAPISILDIPGYANGLRGNCQGINAFPEGFDYDLLLGILIS